MSIAQKIFKTFSSPETLEKAKAESLKWLFDCECGCTFSVWEIGGIRYKAAGNPSKMVQCPKCKKSKSRKVYYKE